MAHAANEIEVCDDVCIFDVDGNSWHRFVNKQIVGKNIPWPMSRYGHIAAAVCSDKMIVYGGKDKHGMLLNDIWMLKLTYKEFGCNIEWECLLDGEENNDNYNECMASYASGSRYPVPRVFAAACSVTNWRLDDELSELGVNKYKQEKQTVSIISSVQSLHTHSDSLNSTHKDIDKEVQDQRHQSTSSSIITELESNEDTEPKKKEITREERVVLDDVLVHGGTDGSDVFDDLWLLQFSGPKLSFGRSYPCWTRILTNGIPSSPRYGHQLHRLTPMSTCNISSAFSIGENTNRLTIIVIGGCCTSPREEIENGVGLDKRDERELHQYALDLQHSYYEQNREALRGGQCLSDLVQLQSIERERRDKRGKGGMLMGREIGYVKSGPKELSRKASSVAGSIAVMEVNSVIAEKRLGVAWRGAQAAANLRGKHGKKARDQLDFSVLDVTEAGMTWRRPILPEVGGDIPSARMHFGSAVIGSNVFVMGGVEPTCLEYRTVDTNPNQPTASLSTTSLLSSSISSSYNSYSKISGSGSGSGSSKINLPASTTTSRPTATSTYCMKVFVLNTLTMQWQSITGSDGLSVCMSNVIEAAAIDVKRAQKDCEHELSRGLSLGIPQGITREYLDARALRDVMSWRFTTLKKEVETLTHSPLTRWGLTLAYPKGQRLLLFGGWQPPISEESIKSFLDFASTLSVHTYNTSQKNLPFNHEKYSGHVKLQNILNMSCVDMGSAVDMTNIVILDCEQDLERRRRIEDEFLTRLERERMSVEKRARQERVVSMYDLRLRKEAEQRAEIAEMALMGVEDIRSALPSLTRPNPVRLIKANEHTMWLEWDSVQTDCIGRPLPPGEPTYLLYLRGGFEGIQEGDPVWILPQRALTEEHESCFDNDGWTEEYKRFYTGKIRGVPSDVNYFDVEYNDGYIERHVPRNRIHRRFPPQYPCGMEWQLGRPVTMKETSELDIETTEESKLAYTEDYLFFNGRVKIPYRSFVDYNPPSLSKDPSWRLIYAGPACQYACQGLIPLEILERDPEMITSVSFRLQTLGTEFPSQEYSLPSFRSCFWTMNKLNTWCNITGDEDDTLTGTEMKQSLTETKSELTTKKKHKAGSNRPRKEVYHTQVNPQRSQDYNSSTPDISNIESEPVTLERDYDTVVAQGTADDML